LAVRQDLPRGHRDSTLSGGHCLKGKQDTPAAHSARQRLLNRSRETGEDYNLLLTRFGIERLLYRLSRSDDADRFVLKGAMLFAVWTGNVYRPTRDLDLLGFGDATAERLVAVFRGLCEMSVEDDGLRFDADTVSCEPIRDDQEYGGMRLKLLVFLGNARIALQVDVGFGDAVTPEAKRTEFPTLLDHPVPVVRAYPAETVVAEKFEAMVSLGMGNSRMKNFYDAWILLREFEMDEATLTKAIRATFGRRRTELPTTLPMTFSEEFIADPTKQSQWQGILKRSGLSADLPFADVVEVIRRRLGPLIGLTR
jgi:predicted nucleotidyltransferase component of viral defense system